MGRLRVASWLMSAVVAVPLGGCGGLPGDDTASSKALPKLLSVRSMSAHYVEMIFDAPVDPSMGSAALYSIVTEDGSELTVREAKLSEDRYRAVITTDTQEERPYTLRLAEGAPISPIQPGGTGVVAANFPGTSTNEFTVGYAVAINNTTVLLVFSDPPTTTSAPVLSNYSINDPDLKITAAVRGTGTATSTVTLTTSPQSDQLYTVKIANLSNSYSLIDPDRNTATFYGIDPVDTTAPKLMGAEPTNIDEVLLSFSEPLENFAGDLASYAVVCTMVIEAEEADEEDVIIYLDMTVLGVELNEWRTQATLSTTSMTPGSDCSVTVTRVEDRAGNVIDPTRRQLEFEVTGEPETPTTDERPRVVSAVATSDTNVLVVFSEPMGPSADEATNYQISGPDTTWLQVLSAARREHDWSAVDLTTRGQTDLLYTVHVGAVKDLAGNPIASPDGLLAPPDGVNPSVAQFYGMPNKDAYDVQVDEDEDGFADWFEMAGWPVTVQLANGEFVTKIVTSDPELYDTDGDGFSDGQENQHGWDPRTSDTDADWVSDTDEFNIWYTDPADQDSDDDGIDDFTEIDFFGTAPHAADTDGDGFSDSEELFDRNRNPLVADLPIPQITVDNIALELDIRSSYTDETGETQSVEDSTSATFSQSRSQTLGTSDTNTTEAENTFGQELGAEVGGDGAEIEWKVSTQINFGQTRAQGYSSTVSRESSEESSEEFQRSVSHALERSENRSVTRNIDSAIVQATVNISNKSNIAFSITNLEVSVLQQDRFSGVGFRPVATLRATGADDPTAQPIYNLGPLEQDRGPILFENTSVFPNRVDDLMREPSGLIFEVVNLDVLDEFGRNLVFTAQEVMDKTASITIDFGDGQVELYQVATSIKGFDENTGREEGLTMEEAMGIIGITSDTLPNGNPNPAAIDATTYHVEEDSNTGVKALVRIRGVENQGSRFWAAVASDVRLEADEDFEDIELHAHDVVLLLYTSDDDGDDLLRREEYFYGSSDTDTDSDDDTLSDYSEVREGWMVMRTPGQPYRAYPSPARDDSDLDGLGDAEEKALGTDPNRRDTDEDGLSDKSELEDVYEIPLFDADDDFTNTKILSVEPYSDWAISAGPDGFCGAGQTYVGDDLFAWSTLLFDQKPWKTCVQSGLNGVIDSPSLTDDEVVATPKIVPGPDGVCDTTTVSGDDVLEGFLVLHSIGATCVNAGANGIIDTTPVDDDYERVAHEGLFGTDPQKRDTDGDGLPDGREIMVGTNPNSKDAGGVTDTDGDGLYDIEEEKGWLVDGVQVHPNANRPDSDFDRIPDVIERAIGSHPLKMDTDDDGLLDHDEFDPENDGWEMPDGSTEEYPTVALQRALDLCDDAPNCNYNPPNDPIGSHPAREDSDGDGLEDKAELDGWEVTWTPAGGVQDSDTFFSDPTTANTDDDALLDGKEFALLTNPEDKDSDGDGTMDHVEVETCRTVETPGSDTFSCRNPLHADRLIRFLAYNLRTVGDCDDTCCNYSGAELAAPSTNAFRISSAFGNRDFGGGNIRGGCGDGAVNEGWDGRFFDNSDYGLGHVFYFLLKTGEQFDVVGQGLQECDDGAEDNDSLSLSPFSYNYTTSAAFPENVIQSATNSITGSGEGTCQFDFTIRFTPLAGCDADPDCPGDGNACTRDKCATASHTCTAEAITCTGSQSCNLGKCVAACTTTAQCGAGNVCHNGGCFTSCTTTCSDSSEECVSGACIPKDQN